MKHSISTLCALALLAGASVAHAITPESGFWVNRNDGGTGYNIEINGNIMALAVYTYDADGKPLWYLSSNALQQDGTYFEGTLDKYRDGQCIVCNYSQEHLDGNDGIIKIKFNSATTAQLTLPNGQTKPLERFFKSNGGTPDTDGLPMTWNGIEMQKLSIADQTGGFCVATLTYKNTTNGPKTPFLYFDALDANGVKIEQTIFHTTALGAGAVAATPMTLVHPCGSFSLKFNAAASSVFSN